MAYRQVLSLLLSTRRPTRYLVAEDGPAALAELMGILLRDGQRSPTVTVDSLHFGTGTPAHTSLGRRGRGPTQVLSPELTEVVRGVLRDGVEQGTAIWARGAVRAPDGQPLVLDGKTGTGDNRVYSTGPDGTRTSVAASRTSTFVFYAGDRFFGTIVAYVEGPKADDHEFTRSLTTGILTVIGPKLAPLLEAGAGEAAAPPGARILSPAVDIGR